MLREISSNSKSPEERINDSILWLYCQSRSLTIPEAIILAGPKRRFGPEEILALMILPEPFTAEAPDPNALSWDDGALLLNKD